MSTDLLLGSPRFAASYAIADTCRKYHGVLEMQTRWCHAAETVGPGTHTDLWREYLGVEHRFGKLKHGLGCLSTSATEKLCKPTSLA